MFKFLNLTFRIMRLEGQVKAMIKVMESQRDFNEKAAETIKDLKNFTDQLTDQLDDKVIQNFCDSVMKAIDVQNQKIEDLELAATDDFFINVPTVGGIN